ncbi:MAG: hypothetical protein ACK5IA_15520 [Cyanobacteriota bacterium]|jgi:hypothetical protein
MNPPPEPPLPDAEVLLQLERRSRNQGSGLNQADLIGEWRLDQVWGKGKREPTAFSSALLRGLGARLEIAPAAGQAVDAGGLRLRNSVRLAGLTLCFEGQGELRGKRPLLMFWFEQVELRSGTFTLFRRNLSRPSPSRLPFFALIAADRGPGGERWLAARGRGGGLARWTIG